MITKAGPRISSDNPPWPNLTHWGWVTHICVIKLNIIGSDNGLSPGRRQAIIWTNAGILLIWTLGTNISEISTEIRAFSFKKMHLKMSSAKWRPFCLGLNVLNEEPGIADLTYVSCFPWKGGPVLGVRQNWCKVLAVSQQNDDTTLSLTQPRKNVIMCLLMGEGVACGGLPFPGTGCPIPDVDNLCLSCIDFYVWDAVYIFNHLPRMFLSTDFAFRITDWTCHHGPHLHAILMIISRDVSGLATDSPCGVWGRGWTTCLLHDSPLFCSHFKMRVGMSVWSDIWYIFYFLPLFTVSCMKPVIFTL